jgi:hypothetical protein
MNLQNSNGFGIYDKFSKRLCTSFQSFEAIMAYLVDSKSKQSKILVKNAFFHTLEPQNRKIYRIKKKRKIEFYFQNSSVLLQFLIRIFQNRTVLTGDFFLIRHLE